MTKRALLCQFILFLCLIPIVSAEIIITQPNVLYNVGDDFNLNVTLAPSVDTTAFMNAYLVCTEGKELEIYKTPISVRAEEEKELSITTTLDPFFVGNSTGGCFVRVKYGAEQEDSRIFTITREIKLTLTFNNSEFNPGELTKLYGKASKANGELLNGFLEISSQELNLEITDVIEEGEFEVEFKFPENSPPGRHELVVRVYEKNAYLETINEAKSAEKVRILQKIKDFDVALNDYAIVPGNELTYKAVVLNQIDQEMEEDVALKIYQPYEGSEKVFQESLIKSGESKTLTIEKNSPPGPWRVEATLKKLTKERIFYVKNLEELSYELANSTLTVTNIGNVLFEKPIEITVGNVTQIKNIKLNLAESKKFALSAPEGEYDIHVTDGIKKESVGPALLTGRVISVDDVSRFFNVKVGTITLFAWILLTLILAALAIYFYRKVSKKTFRGRMPGFKAPRIIKESEYSDISRESDEIEGGTKQKADIVSLNIRNNNELQQDGSAISTIDQALLKAKEANAKVYLSGRDHRVIVFSPIVTQEEDNTMKAVNIANIIKQELDRYNKTSQESKILYGVGIHSGELIIERRGENFKFVSLGNALRKAKILSESANKEILISKEFHGRTLGKIRVQKVSPSVWKLSDMASKYKYEEFIERFEKRKKRN